MSFCLQRCRCCAHCARRRQHRRVPSGCWRSRLVCSSPCTTHDTQRCCQPYGNISHFPPISGCLQFDSTFIVSPSDFHKVRNTSSFLMLHTAREWNTLPVSFWQKLQKARPQYICRSCRVVEVVVVELFQIVQSTLVVIKLQVEVVDLSLMRN